MTLESVIREFPQMEECFVIVSQLTRKPYVVCDKETFDDEIYLYAEEAEAVAHATRLNEDKRPSRVLKVLKSETLLMLNDIATYGVNSIIFQKKGEVVHIPLDRLIRRPDISKLPEDKKPVENPSLQLSMIYFFQEVRRVRENQNNIAPFKDLEEEMLVNMVRGKFLIPLKTIEQDGKKVDQMVFVKMPTGAAMMPIFSDGTEYRQFKGKEDFKLVVMKFENLSSIPMPEECKGIVINPSGVSVPILKEMIPRFVSQFGK